MARTHVLQVTVDNVDGSIGGRHHLWFTSATEAYKVYRRINRGAYPDYEDEPGAEALEPEILHVDTTKRGFVEFLNEHCAEKD
tara:strand:- start:747 stop:995 length:249 start_codon:yes stop_codon:yes gene_type:complete